MSITITAEHPDTVLSEHTTDDFLTALKDDTVLWLTAYDTYDIVTVDSTAPGTEPGSEAATFRVEARTVVLPLRMENVTFDSHARMTATATAKRLAVFRSVEYGYEITQDRRGKFSITCTGIRD